MQNHFVGKNLTPDPSPDGEGSKGNSLAVVMFVMIARGEAPVHEPDNEFKIIQLREEERYCLRCLDMRWHDVLEGDSPKLEEIRGTHGHFRMARCRVCEEVRKL